MKKKLTIVIDEIYVPELVKKVKPLAKSIEVEDEAFDFDFPAEEATPPPRVAEFEPVKSSRDISDDEVLASMSETPTESVLPKAPKNDGINLLPKMDLNVLKEHINDTNFRDGLTNFNELSNRRTFKGFLPHPPMILVMIVLNRWVSMKELHCFMGVQQNTGNSSMSDLIREGWVSSKKMQRPDIPGLPSRKVDFYIIKPHVFSKLRDRWCGAKNITQVLNMMPVDLVPDNPKQRLDAEDATYDIQEYIVKSIRQELKLNN